MGSQLVAVRSAFATKLALETGFANVACSYAYKRGKEPRESAWTVDGRFTHEVASLRAAKTFRNEEGRFGLRILVRGIAAAQETTSARAMALGAIVEDYIAIHANWNNGALGVTVNTLTVEGDGELLEAYNDNGTLAELTLPIRYTARLT